MNPVPGYINEDESLQMSPTARFFAWLGCAFLVLIGLAVGAVVAFLIASSLGWVQIC